MLQGRVTLFMCVAVTWLFTRKTPIYKTYTCQYRRKTLSGFEPSFMWAASLSLFLLGAPVNVCCTSLRARGACPLPGYWLLSLFTWPTLTSILFVRGTGRNWTARLVTTDCLAVRLRLWQPWLTFITSLNWTDVAWYSRFVTIVINNQFRYLLGCSNLLGLLLGQLILPPLTPTVK